MEGRIVIKAELGNDIRKILIHNDEVTYDELAIMMQRIFKGAVKPDDEIVLKYRDEDGDLVTLYDTSDVAFALQTSRQYLRVKLFLNGFERSLADNEVKDIKSSLRSMRNEINQILDRLGDEPTRVVAQSHSDKPESSPAEENIESRTPDVANVAPPDAHEFDPLDARSEPPSAGRPESTHDEASKQELDRASQYSGSELGDQSHSFQQPSTTLQPQTQTAQQSQYNAQMAQYQQQQMYAASQASTAQPSQPATTASYPGYSQQTYPQTQAQPTQQTQQYYPTSTPSTQANASMTPQGYTQAQQAYYQQMQGQQAQPGQLQQTQAGQGQPPQAQQPQGQGQPPQGQSQPGMPQAQQMQVGYQRMPGPSNPYSKPGQLGAGYPRATGMYPRLAAPQYPATSQQYPPAGQPGSVMNTQ